MTCAELSYILQAYENGVLSISQNGSPNLFNQAKVCDSEPMKKLAYGISQ